MIFLTPTFNKQKSLAFGMGSNHFNMRMPKAWRIEVAEHAFKKALHKLGSRDGYDYILHRRYPNGDGAFVWGRNITNIIQSGAAQNWQRIPINRATWRAEDYIGPPPKQDGYLGNGTYRIAGRLRHINDPLRDRATLTRQARKTAREKKKSPVIHGIVVDDKLRGH